jgi:hypothetical protein
MYQRTIGSGVIAGLVAMSMGAVPAAHRQEFARPSHTTAAVRAGAVDRSGTKPASGTVAANAGGSGTRCAGCISSPGPNPSPPNYFASWGISDCTGGPPSCAPCTATPGCPCTGLNNCVYYGDPCANTCNIDDDRGPGLVDDAEAATTNHDDVRLVELLAGGGDSTFRLSLNLQRNVVQEYAPCGRIVAQIPIDHDFMLQVLALEQRR